MQCPNCQSEVREGAAFCSMCGAAVAAPAPEGTPPQPTTPVPEAAPSADEEYARQLAEYERQRAAYEQQTAQGQQYAQQPATPAGAPWPSAQTAPPKKRRTGLIVTLVLVALFGCLACGAAGFFGYRAWKAANNEATPIETPSETDEGTTDELEGYATAEEAVAAELDDAGYGDWVYQLYEEGDTEVTYWAGPPASEFAEEIVVVRNADGSWSVTEVNPLDFGGDVSGDVGSRDEAMGVVSQFLYAVQDDRGEDAHALTVEPFSNDAASAQVSAGGLETFEVSGATGQSDGSFWVQTVQVWYGAEERWEYWVVPTDAGYAIADVREW